MLTSRTQVQAIFVDRSTQNWVVRDSDGNFWRLPDRARAWDHRELFVPTEATELEPVPGHYKHMLDLP